MTCAEPIPPPQTSLEGALGLEIVPLVHQTGLVIRAVIASTVGEEANVGQVVGDGIVDVRLRVVEEKVVCQIGFVAATNRRRTDRDAVSCFA